MKKKINRQRLFDTMKTSEADKRGYYFHPDEDFREDWDWGKSLDVELTENNSTSSDSSLVD